MASTLELQQYFAALLTRDPHPDDGAGIIVGGALTPAQRIAIYRNAFHISLRDALATTYPALEKLVGRDCFADLANRFLRQSPPRQPVLAEYGGGFADFLAAQRELADYPFLPDVARLEWAMTQAHEADAAATIDPMAYGRIPADDTPRLCLTPHPSCHRLSSPWPIDAIWQAQQPGQDEAPIPLDQPVELLVWRQQSVVYRRLTAGEALLFDLLASGQPLLPAAETALTIAPDLNLGQILGDHLIGGVYCRFHLHEEP